MNLRPHHDRLAAEYVLGTLHGRARARFTRLLRDDVSLQTCVGFWQRALTPMAAPLSAVPSPAVWRAIAARVQPQPERDALQARAAKPGWFERWFGVRSLAPLAMGVVLGVTLSLNGPTPIGTGESDPTAAPTATTQLPESYVGVLAAADGKAGLIVSSLRHGTTMDVKEVKPPVDFDSTRHTLFLWAIEADGTTRAIGAVPRGRFVQVPLAKTSEQLFAKATELAVSIEVIGSTPAMPNAPYVYRGLCGKLWRVPPPAPKQ
jgi:anti-sigma-K factor RskA